MRNRDAVWCKLCNRMVASNWCSTAAAHSNERLKSWRECIFSFPRGIQLLFLSCETSSVTGWKLSLNSVFFISLAVLKSDQAAGRQPPAHSVRNSDTEQCAGTVVAVWLPDAWLPRHREAVHSTLQQANSGESRSKEFGQGARSRSVCLCYLLVKVNIFWEVMVCVLVVRNQLPLFWSYCFEGTCCILLVIFKWRQQVPPKYLYLSTKLQGVTSQKIA